MGLFGTKSEIERKGVFICFHGFKVDKSEFNFLENEFNDYDFIFPNLYSMFDCNLEDTYGWIKNIKSYLNDVSQEYDNIVLVGYSLGGLFASICADLPYINKVILITPFYSFITLNDEKRPTIESLDEYHLKDNNIWVQEFVAIHSLYLNLYERNLKMSNAKILIFQGIATTSLDYLHSQKLFNDLYGSNRQMICIGSSGTEILKDNNALIIIPTISRMFIEDKINPTLSLKNVEEE